MEIKRFDDYTIEEQDRLFKHYWDMYADGVNATEDEFEVYRNLIELDRDLVKDSLVIAFTVDGGIERMIDSIRSRTVHEYLESMRLILLKNDYKKIHGVMEEKLISRLVDSYNRCDGVCGQRNGSVQYVKKES